MTNTILQVEDDPNDVFLLQHAMKKAGVTNSIQVANDGREAINYLSGVGKFADRTLFPLPCLVLLDLKLPFVMGLDVLKWIRQQPGPATVVVLLSASGQESDIAAAYRLGANAYLVKPSEASKLQDMAKAIKDFWLTQNTPPPDFPVEEAARVVDSRALRVWTEAVPASDRSLDIQHPTLSLTASRANL
jgi:two-component system response regulator